jgi:hypothetical protein
MSLEPFAIGDYSWGDISAVSKGLPDQLCNAIGAGTICTPGTTATLSLVQMQIVGLSNVTLSQPAVSGSQVTGTFEFGQATSLPSGLTVPTHLEIQGTFAITLSCCATTDGRTCSAPAVQPTVTGTFAVRFGNAALAVTLDVQAAEVDGQPQYTVTAKGLSLTADPVTFSFKAQGPAAGKISKLLGDAFTAGAGPTAVSIINDRLAAPPTLTTLASVLTPAFTSLASPPLLAFAVSMLYDQAAKPTGSYYLPSQIKKATSPVLDPFSAGGWDVPDVGHWYPAAGATICASIGAENNLDEIQQPGSMVPLPLSGITVGGTSNLMVLPMLTIGNSVYGMVACNAVADWPLTLGIGGDFALTVSCCLTGDRQSCAGPPEASTGSGTYQAAIAAATVGVGVTMSTTPDGKELIATVDAIYFRCDPNVDNGQNIRINIQITSIPDGERAVWNDMAMEIFNSPKAASAIVDQIRAKLNQAAVRDRLSAIATQAIQSILQADADLARRVRREVATAQSRQGARHARP